MDIYNDHLLRRWEMDASGQIGCFRDAIDIRLHGDDIVQAVDAHNELLKQAEADRRTYEAALRVSEPTDEPLTITVVDEDGNESEQENPLWTAYNGAQAAIAGVSADVLAWINASEAEPEELTEGGNETAAHKAWRKAIADRDAAYRDNAPEFEVVTDGPALHPLAPTQFWAMVEFMELKPAIEAAFEAIADPMERAVAKARFERAELYQADNPLFAQLMPAVGLTQAQFDAAWMQAASL